MYLPGLTAATNRANFKPEAEAEDFARAREKALSSPTGDIGN